PHTPPRPGTAKPPRTAASAPRRRRLLRVRPGGRGTSDPAGPAGWPPRAGRNCSKRAGPRRAGHSPHQSRSSGASPYLESRASLKYVGLKGQRTRDKGQRTPPKADDKGQGTKDKGQRTPPKADDKGQGIK